MRSQHNGKTEFSKYGHILAAHYVPALKFWDCFPPSLFFFFFPRGGGTGASMALHIWKQRVHKEAGLCARRVETSSDYK